MVFIEMKRTRAWIFAHKKLSILSVVVLVIVGVVVCKQLTKSPVNSDFVGSEYIVQTGDIQTSLTLQ